MKDKKTKKCNCFTCTHKDPELREAYCIGYIEACNWFLNWAKSQKVELGSIGDDDLGGIYAQIKCNCDETHCYVDSLQDVKNNYKGEKEDMYIFALRYCLGSQTISILTCVNMITKHLDDLSLRALNVMKNDLERFFNMDSYGASSFPEYVIKTWESLYKDLENELSKRSLF